MLFSCAVCSLQFAVTRRASAWRETPSREGKRCLPCRGRARAVFRYGGTRAAWGAAENGCPRREPPPALPRQLRLTASRATAVSFNQDRGFSFFRAKERESPRKRERKPRLRIRRRKKTPSASATRKSGVLFRLILQHLNFRLPLNGLAPVTPCSQGECCGFRESSLLSGAFPQGLAAAARCR